MAVVTGLTAARMLEIEAASVVSGAIDGSGHLILTKHDGSTIDAGNALVAVPNEDLVHFLNASSYNKDTPPGSYPDGVSLMYISDTEATADWPTFAGKFGSIRTINYTAAYSDADTVQTWTRLHGTATTPEMWMRAGNNSGWSSWIRIATTADLVAPTIVSTITAPLETDASSAYPLGVSIFNVNSVTTSPVWSVNGGNGSVLTVNQSNLRCFQTFTSYAGGSSLVKVWTRVYHNPEGWTSWQSLANPADPSTMGITGEIKMWTTSSAPSGWLFCDGSAVDRTTYANLFAVIGTTFGAGNGTTTFNVPSFKGRVPVGYDSAQTEFDSIGETGGEKTHVLTTAEMPQHTHVQNAHAHSFGGNGAMTDGPTGVSYGIQNGTFYGFKATGTNNTTATNQNAGGDGAHNNLQPYITIRYIIKA